MIESRMASPAPPQTAPTMGMPSSTVLPNDPFSPNTAAWAIVMRKSARPRTTDRAKTGSATEK